MSKEKHFIDTSVARPIISSSSKVKEYYKENLSGKLYYCTYIKMEIIRGYIIPCINFYFTFRMPNIESISDALSLWNHKFNTREIDADAKKKGEYSLGDVLLQERFEKQLTENCGYTKEEVKQFSPFYYGV